ncbi:hypothetical protein NIES4071_91320 [Calothrix sp. NIES-4071]|nr:hypothetical protein NIES4071_91320 [Calothrix sp. NIES-4071]BAZ63399.1 hypothetical protein NIES4105_91250 [Calothrix sp. NIES-4105]
MSKKKKQVTIRGESVDIVERLSEITGLTHRHVVELLLRKYGKELESWVGVPLLSSVSIQEIQEPIPALPPATTPTQHYPEPTINLPKDPGKGLKPIQL